MSARVAVAPAPAAESAPAVGPARAVGPASARARARADEVAGAAGRRPGAGRESALYEGTVRHRRFSPVGHAFTSRLVMTLLDLDEVEPLVDRLPLWSRRRWAPVRFDRRDYLDGSDRPLRQALGDVVEARLGRRPAGPVRMLTQLRTWGWLFNPLTVYWCYRPAGAENRRRVDDHGRTDDDLELDVVVLEVSNTPWKERHHYVIDLGAGRGDGATFPKVLHVSPFMEMDLDYRVRFRGPRRGRGTPLTLRLELLDGDEKRFDADLSLRRVELTPVTAVTMLVRHPLQTLRVSAGIHAQALRLWAKRVPVVAHPSCPGGAGRGQTDEAVPAAGGCCRG